eukprot:scaffold23.g4083.t1
MLAATVLFYLSEADVGRNRAEACKESVQELNTSVPVAASVVELSEDFLSQFQVVVAVDMALDEATRGVFASVFCDFGPSFTVYDVDGEEPHTGIVAGITPGAPTLVTAVEDERLEFQDGAQKRCANVANAVRRSLSLCCEPNRRGDGRLELRGDRPGQHLPELQNTGLMGAILVANDAAAFADGVQDVITLWTAHSFELEVDSTGFAPYQAGAPPDSPEPEPSAAGGGSLRRRCRAAFARGGIVTQHKPSKTLEFRPLARALEEPGEFLLSDFSKVGVF